MKFIISVLALIAGASTGSHHTDAFKDDSSGMKTPEEERHPLKPDYNYVHSLNSQFLFDMHHSLVQIFWDRQSEMNSFQKSNQGTDLVNGILTAEAYNNQVVDTSGKYVGTKPYFIYWPKFSRTYQQLPASSMNKLAQHFEGNVAFRVADPFMDENLRMSYEIYDSGKAFYIDGEGKAYIYPGVISLNATRDWIESRKYRMSPFQFTAPAIIGEYRLIWANIKKEVRHWYGNNLRDQIEPYLKKVGFTYCVDMDPYDWDNIKLNQKTDRQIIFIVAFLFWILEYVWDMITAASSPGDKKKTAPQKSFLKKKPAAAATGSGKKEKRDKVE